MAWPTMHFAVGMACSGAVALTVCTFARRGWRWIPAAMTAGGFWAMVPDMPRLFRVDFPSLPLSGLLGRMSLERALHRWGDLFFFHHRLDAQPKELALAGLFLILLFYNLAILHLMGLERRQRRLAQRAHGAPLHPHAPAPTHHRPTHRKHAPHDDREAAVIYRIRPGRMRRAE